MSDTSLNPIPLLLSKVAFNTFAFLIWGWGVGGKEKNRQVFVKKTDKLLWLL